MITSQYRASRKLLRAPPSAVVGSSNCYADVLEPDDGSEASHPTAIIHASTNSHTLRYDDLRFVSRSVIVPHGWFSGKTSLTGSSVNRGSGNYLSRSRVTSGYG